MNFSLRTLCLLSGLSLLAGCNSLGGVPEIAAPSLAPQPLHPGDTALVTIDVKDKNGIVASVVGFVEEWPEKKLKLYDNGTEGDSKAGDSTWSLAVQIPIDTEPGTFNLTFTAYRSDGVAVPIRADDGTIASLSTKTQLVLVNKQ